LFSPSPAAGVADSRAASQKSYGKKREEKEKQSVLSPHSARMHDDSTEPVPILFFFPSRCIQRLKPRALEPKLISPLFFNVFFFFPPGVTAGVTLVRNAGHTGRDVGGGGNAGEKYKNIAR
jgi:hypothetical protein